MWASAPTVDAVGTGDLWFLLWGGQKVGSLRASSKTGVAIRSLFVPGCKFVLR